MINNTTLNSGIGIRVGNFINAQSRDKFTPQARPSGPTIGVNQIRKHPLESLGNCSLRDLLASDLPAASAKHISSHKSSIAEQTRK